MALIELEDITKQYRKGSAPVVHALRGVTLAIGRGELVAIAGASGSGKSTLMNVLGLLDRPDAGRYRFDGREVSTLSAREQAGLRNARIGFVFQAFHLLPRTSALENVELPLVYSDRADIRGLGRRALDLVGLSDRVDPHAGRALRRPAAARGHRPRARERARPDARRRADGQSGQRVGRGHPGHVRGAPRAGRTIVIVTHDAAVAARCPRRIRIADGRVVEDTQPLPAGPPSPGSDAGHAALQEVR